MKTKLLPGFLKRTIVLACLLFSFGNIFSQYYYSQLQVLDPRKSWWGEQGTIDSAIFVVEPKGIYAQVDMYLTFSAQNTYFSSTDTLEVQMTFNLPKGSIVNDSWLLINGIWEKALILDRWTATSIYEGIVKRRKDPSILTKNEYGYYHLNVFPMAAEETRTAKISFLVPFNFAATNATIQLPGNIIDLSANNTFSKVSVRENAGYKNPGISDNSITFSNDSSDYKIAVTSGIKLDFLSFDTPLKDGIYMAKYDQSNSGIYQLAFVPDQLTKVGVNKKLLILVDNDSEGYFSNTEITNSLKNIIKSNLNRNDTFNVFFSGLKVKKLNQQWIPAVANSTDSILESIDESFYSGYSYFSSLLVEGITFCNAHPNASILLVSNSAEFNNLKRANAFLEDLKAKFENIPAINIFDYNKNGNGFYSGNTYYSGNSYLYGVLSRSTKGAYYKISYNESFFDGLSAISQNIGTYIPAFDLITNLENGFCYGRMEVLNNLTQIYANKAVLTVGKYKGSFPFELQISGYINDSIFLKKISIADSLIYNVDSSSNTIWAGNYIEEMEAAESLKNEEISKIIEFSIENRVLSKYTAFLTLEPDMVIEPCDDCEPGEDRPVATKITDKINSDKVEIFGNPFEDFVRVKISFEEPQNTDLNVQIFNTMGQLMKIFKVPSSSEFYEFEWDGKDQNGKEVAAGTYVIKLSTGKYNKTIKVMKK